MEKPWEKRADWKSGRISSNLGASAGCLLAFGSVYALGGWSMGIATFLWGKPGMPVWAGLLLAAIMGSGALILVAGVVGVVRARKFGAVLLELRTIPLPIGGTADGVIEAGFDLPKDAEAALTLTCMRTTRSERRDSKGKHETNYHHEQVSSDSWTVPHAEIEALPGTVRIPVRRPISAGALPTLSDASSNVSIDWTLVCHVPTPGLDFIATFQVPVFPV